MTAALALPLVERVIDGDTITVQLDLAPVAGQIGRIDTRALAT